jgi:hypothetical protein
MKPSKNAAYLSAQFTDKQTKLSIHLYITKGTKQQNIFSSQISGSAKKSRKIFFIECGTHPREWLSPATCMWLIKTVRWMQKCFFVSW